MTARGSVDRPPEPAKKQPAKKQVVYILAVGHTGSTLLDLMIGSHPACTSLGEFVHVPRRLQSGELLCQICGVECDAWRRFKETVVAPRYHEAAFEAFGSSILVDSSKRLTWIAANRLPSDVDVKFVRLHRNGLAVLNKIKRKTGKISAPAVKGWIQGNLDIDRFLSGVAEERKLDVSYEKLCTDPEDTLSRVCRFLGIPFDPEMTEFWKKRHHVLNGNAKPISLVALYQGNKSMEDLHPDVRDFVERYGYAVKLDTRYQERLSEEDRNTFSKHGQWLNSAYGYGDPGRAPLLPFYRLYYIVSSLRWAARVLRDRFRGWIGT